jgi:glycosyltransferase involved in cell wall biosynthesis
MRIAQVSQLFESVPPKGYGGTERVISYLTEELVRQGHEVTLFATADSITTAKLVPSVERSLRAEMLNRSWLAYDAIQMDKVGKQANSFDIIHFHTDYLHFPLTRNLGTPHVTTLHGRLDLAELVPLFEHFSACPMVSISDSQRSPLAWANWCGTVYHGLPPDLYRFHPEAGKYFVFLGRISPEKRVDRAIEIALSCDTPLYIAAKVDKADEAYFNNEISHLFKHPLIHYIGEVDEPQKHALLAQAKALLFPIDWPEPFGLVMIEAFSCGVPVIAYSHGSVPEIMEEGINGFIVHNQQEAIQAARQIEKIDRAKCRASFERRFTAFHMAESYLQVYQRLISRASA